MPDLRAYPPEKKNSLAGLTRIPFNTTQLPSRMASVSPPEKPLHYACKCLNVQIISSTQSPTSSPEGTCDPAYTPIFVNDDGIVIVGFLFHKFYCHLRLLSLRHIHK